MKKPCLSAFLAASALILAACGDDDRVGLGGPEPEKVYVDGTCEVHGTKLHKEIWIGASEGESALGAQFLALPSTVSLVEANPHQGFEIEAGSSRLKPDGDKGWDFVGACEDCTKALRQAYADYRDANLQPGEG